MAPKGDAYNIDWVWSFDSNVHIASHRDWFTNFTACDSNVGSAHNTDTWAVEGVGDVELEVRRLIGAAVKKPNGPKNTIITLRNVLYVPSFRCNVMGNPVREDYDVSIGAERWLCSKKSGVGVGMLDKNPAGMTKVLLKGQAKGESGLPKDMDWKVNAVWPDQEKQKWAAEKSKT